MDIDYNKPANCAFTNKPLDNKKIKVVDWLLKPTLQASSSYCYDLKKGFADYKKVSDCVRVVGTELQLYNLFCYMLHNHGWQQQDSWIVETTKKYIKKYRENNNKPIIL
tara:strand:+ start:183 stop:509 length:327 start_codon:yes stop_codon:yes gene_type:complete